MAAKQFKVPFDERGNLMHYARNYPDDYGYRYSAYRAHEWRDREDFTATLGIDHAISGMSAKYFIWTSPDGHQYPMFATDLLHLVRYAQVNQGIVTGVWYPCKRGANYGIQYVRAA